MAENREAIYYRAGYKYQLAKDYTVEVFIPPIGGEEVHTPFLSLTPVGRLTIRKDYAWDGPSGPTIDTKTFMRGSLVHDALYQLIRLGFVTEENRKRADEVLYRICREDGMWWPRAQWVYAGVRWGGHGSAEPNAEPPVLTAP